MQPDIQNITQLLRTETPNALESAINQIKSLQDLSVSEKEDLTRGLMEILYSFRHSTDPLIAKLAVRAERRMATFGADIIPLIMSEMVEADGESAAYLAKVLRKIGAESLAHIEKALTSGSSDSHAEINLLQACSVFSLQEAQQLFPLVISYCTSQDFQVASMALFALGRMIDRSSTQHIPRAIITSIFEQAFNNLSHSRPLVRKQAARTLGHLLKKGVLEARLEKQVEQAYLSILGRDGEHNWDRAFIVRREAEEFLRYIQKKKPSVRYGQSFTIRNKKLLNGQTWYMEINAPFIARKIQPGQFIIVRPHEHSERIPLSICGWDRTQGTIHLVISSVGKTTTEINQMNSGDSFKDVVGPLGERSHKPSREGTVVVIGGGYGTGAIVPTADELRLQGYRVIGIAGARSQEALVLTDRLASACNEVLVTTNDGSAGIKGFVTDALKKVMDREKVGHVLAIGPVPMMKAVSEMTRNAGIPTYVSLNAIMVDGTGMCGACRVSVGGETKFACFHGPDFDGHRVDFDNLMKRQRMFVKEEQLAMSTTRNS